MRRGTATVALALVLALVVGVPAAAWAQDMQIPVQVPLPSGVGLGEAGGGLGALALLGVSVERWIVYRKGREAKEDERQSEARLSAVIVEHIHRAMDAHRAEDTAVHHAADLRLHALEQARTAEAERWKELRDELGQLRKAVLDAVTRD